MRIDRGHTIIGPLQLDIHVVRIAMLERKNKELDKQRKLPFHSILLWNLSFGPRRACRRPSKLFSEKHLKSFVYTPDDLSKCLLFIFFFAGQIRIWIHSLVHLIMKFQKFNMDHLGHVFFFYPGYTQFFETENPARSESPSSVSRENNCVKMDINRGK